MSKVIYMLVEGMDGWMDGSNDPIQARIKDKAPRDKAYKKELKGWNIINMNICEMEGH